MARLVFDEMGEKQGEDLVILDIRPVSLITDYFVIGTVKTRRQLSAVVNGVAERVRKDGGLKPALIEGEPASGWVLIDLGDVVVHVFDAERRAYYALDALWDEAPLVARMP